MKVVYESILTKIDDAIANAFVTRRTIKHITLTRHEFIEFRNELHMCSMWIAMPHGRENDYALTYRHVIIKPEDN